MADGKCNCGTVAFQIKSQVSDVYICHCSIFRKTTGGSGFAVTIVSNDDFSWVQGKEHIQYWAKPEHEWHTSFCKTCGTPLPGVNDDSNMYIPVGALTTGSEKLSAAHHIWVDSKANWEEISDSGKQHAEGYVS